MTKHSQEEEKQKKEKEERERREEEAKRERDVARLDRGIKEDDDKIDGFESEKTNLIQNNFSIGVQYSNLSTWKEEDLKIQSLDSQIGQTTAERDLLIQEKALRLIQKAKEEEPENKKKPNGDKNPSPDGRVDFKSIKDLEAFSDEMEKSYRDLGVPCFTEKYRDVSFRDVAINTLHLPEACKGKDVFKLNHEELEDLRAEIKKEMVEGKSKFSQEYQKQSGNLNGDEKQKHEVVGVFSGMVVKAEEEAEEKKKAAEDGKPVVKTR